MTMDFKNSTISSSTPHALCCNFFIYWQMETWVTIFFKAITTDFFDELNWPELWRMETHGHGIFFFLWTWNLVSCERHLVPSTSSSESHKETKETTPEISRSTFAVLSFLQNACKMFYQVILLPPMSNCDFCIDHVVSPCLFVLPSRHSWP